MKLAQSLLAALFATLLIATAGIALAGHDVEDQVKIFLDGDSEATVIDVEDMEVGDTRQLFTDSGKEVLITRTEEGFDLEVDGKSIDIGGKGHFFGAHGLHGEGHGETKVIVKHLSGDDHGFHFINTDGENVTVDINEDFHWVHGEGAQEMRVFALGGHQAAAQRLEESGVLDDLSDEKRQEILDALEPDEHRGTRIERRVMVIEVDEDDDSEE